MEHRVALPNSQCGEKVGQSSWAHLEGWGVFPEGLVEHPFCWGCPALLPLPLATSSSFLATCVLRITLGAFFLPVTITPGKPRAR